MPFGLKNAPQTIQHAVDVIHASTRWQWAIVYIRDIILFFKSLKEHVKYVKKELGLLVAARMTLKFNKFCFLSKSIDYFGPVLSTGKLQVAWPTTKAIGSLQYLENSSQMKSFLRLVNVLTCFVQGFAKIFAPLNCKLRKEGPSLFGLYDQDCRAIAELKNRFVRCQ